VARAPGELQALESAGVDLARVTRELEDEGVEKFAASYRSVLSTVDTKIGLLV